MRALTWLVGTLVILLGLNAGASRSSMWTAVWSTAAVLWILVGCGLGFIALAKLAAGKVGAGAVRTGETARGRSPAPKE